MEEELFEAAEIGNTEILDQITVEYKSMEEELFEAAEIGNTEILDQIQDSRILAEQNPQGDTACHVALQQGHLEFASKIASFHPQILYTRNMEGDTVLHCALKIGQPEFFVKSVNLIRDFLGENINYTDKLPRKVNSLMLEARRCYNSSQDGEERSLVYVAAVNGYFRAVMILMDTPALSRTDGPRGSTALHAAVRHGHYGIVQLLMQRKRSLVFVLDEDELTPMFIAVSLKNVKMCNLILMVLGSWRILAMKRIVGGDNGTSPFHLAAQNDDSLQIFRLFTELCPCCYYLNNELGQNVLHIAIKAKTLHIVKFIMKELGLSSWMIDQHDNDGETPLSLAVASHDNEEMLNALLVSPVNVLSLEDDKENVQQKAKEHYQGSLLVMATLIATVTFAAAFSLPGGYKSDDPNEGTAALIRSAAFRVFLVFDTISFLTSIMGAVLLIYFAGMPNFCTRLGIYRFECLRAAVCWIRFSVVFMIAAFAAGVWAVIGSECKWLAILIVAVISVLNPVVLRYHGRFIRRLNLNYYNLKDERKNLI